MTQRLHEDFNAININTALVQRLLATQFPQWANLPITPAVPQGWDNRTFRLGADMSVRLPSAVAYTAQIEKEHHWLPFLAPHLPLLVPVPLALGRPAAGFPWHWSIYRWIEGEVASRTNIADVCAFATTLAGFLTKLQSIDPVDGPSPGPHNFQRGGSLEFYDAETRQAIVDLKDEVGAEAVTQVWEMALTTTQVGPPVWFHGDVAASNLLIRNGQLGAVIDFGCAGVGDPACDVAIAWTLFSGESRRVFRTALRVDEGTWIRGRGWALWKALIVLAEYRRTDLAKATEARRVLNEILVDAT